MPEDALLALDVTLDAAASIVESRLAVRGGPRAERRAVQRACVVLCATAWEVYVEDSIVWLAQWADDELDGPRQLPQLLRKIYDQLPTETITMTLLEASTATMAEVEPEPHEPEQRGWAHALSCELSRRVAGPRGPGPTFQSIADTQRSFFGEALIEQVRLPNQSVDYVPYWVDVLVAVRNTSAHRGVTPEPLDTSGVRSWIEFVRAVAHELDHHIRCWATRAART